MTSLRICDSILHRWILGKTLCPQQSSDTFRGNTIAIRSAGIFLQFQDHSKVPSSHVNVNSEELILETHDAIKAGRILFLERDASGRIRAYASFRPKITVGGVLALKSAWTAEGHTTEPTAQCCCSQMGPRFEQVPVISQPSHRNCNSCIQCFLLECSLAPIAV